MIENNMRIGGLASGMDIDSIVDDLMKAERIPLEKLKQKKQLLEWKRDDYREMNKLLKDLDNLIFDGIDRQSTFLQKTVSSSNEDAVTARAVNVSGNLSAAVDVKQLATAETWISQNEVSEKFAKDLTLKFKVTRPGEGEAEEVKVEIDSEDTLTDVIRKLNNSDLGVAVFLDEFPKIENGDSPEKRIVMTMEATGADAKIELDDDTAAFMKESLGFNVDDSELQSEGTGQNAVFEINGYETERTSNTFMINGMEYTLKNTTDSPVRLSTATDTDAILDTIVEFVDEYNEVIETINGKLTETRHRDYKPLTDAQREEMSDREIELWEEKAKSGMLRSDSILSSGLNRLRMDLYSPVERDDGTVLQLSDIGISTSSDYRDRGKLIVNEAELRDAINEDPNQVYELFNARNTDDSHAMQGIASRLRQSINEMTTDIEEKAGNTLRTNQQFTIGRNLLDVDEQIAQMEERLIQTENRYWRQFTAMERAIQQANQQSMFLMEQFGGG